MTNLVDLTCRIIIAENNYNDFSKVISANSNKVKGDYQEIFAKIYFESHAKHYNVKKYYSRLLDDKIPSKYNLNPEDVGSDAIIEHIDGKVSLVQVKFRTNLNAALLRSSVSNMALESAYLRNEGLLRNFYLFSNTYFPPRKVTDTEINENNIKYILHDDLYNCQWDIIKTYANNIVQKISTEISIVMPPLRQWQLEALDFIYNGLPSTDESSEEYSEDENDESSEESYYNDEYADDYDDEDKPSSSSAPHNCGRKQIIAACGSGKTLLGISIVIKYKLSLIVVPSLQLLGQWFENMCKYIPYKKYLLVGSDIDDRSESMARVPYDLTTSSDIIGKFLRENIDDEVIMISTYHSLHQILEVENINIDMTICDEAHNCCASNNNKYTLPVKSTFPSTNIIFMTATPKIIKSADINKDIYSMDAEDKFGERYTYPFRKAIEDNIISDYSIEIGHGHLEDDSIIDEDHFNANFIIKSIQKYAIRNMLVFSSSHNNSKKIYNMVKKLFLENNITDYNLHLMPSAANARYKSEAVELINNNDKCIIFNVKVFELGTNLPNLKSVFINGNKNSVISIIQSVSRCLRYNPDKGNGIIIIPCLVRGDDYDNDGNNQNLRTIITSIGSVDEALEEEIYLTSKKASLEHNRINIWNIDAVTNEVIYENGDIINNFTVKLYERLVAFNSIFNERKWFDKLNQVKEYMDKKGDRPSQRTNDKNIRILGNWLCTQITNYNQNIDKCKQIMKNNIYVHAAFTEFLEDDKYSEYFLTNNEQWYTKLNQLKDYMDKQIKSNEKYIRPPQTSKDKTTKILGKWLSQQLVHYNQDKFKCIMNDIDIHMAFTEFLEDDKYSAYLLTRNQQWHVKLNQLKEYMDKQIKSNEKYIRPPTNSKDEATKVLGQWLSDQLKNYNQNIDKCKCIMKKNKDVHAAFTEFLEDDKYSKYFLTNNEQWYAKLNQLKDYMDKQIKDNEKSIRPSTDSKDENTKILGKWLSQQLVKYNQNIDECKHGMKDKDVHTAFTEFLEDDKYSEYFLTNNEQWYAKLNQLKQYMDKQIEDNDIYIRPSSISKDETTKILGQWLSHQLGNYNQNIDDCKHRMKDIDIHVTFTEFLENEKYSKYFTKNDQWHSKLYQLKGYMDKQIENNEKNIRPSRQSKDENINFLGCWLSNQLSNYDKHIDKCKGIIKDKDLHVSFTEFLEDDKYIEFLLTKKEVWYVKLKKVKEYMDKQIKNNEKNIRPSTISKDKNKKILGAWLSQQLNNYNKNISKCKGRLKDKDVYVSFTEFLEDNKYSKYFLTNNEQWYTKLNQLKDYMDKQIKDNEKYIKPSTKSKDENTKILGKWLSTQCTNYNQNIDKCKQIMKDKDIHTAFMGFLEDDKYSKYFLTNTEQWYVKLKQVKDYMYKQIEDNDKYIRPSADSKDENIKILGYWLGHQIQNYNQNIDKCKGLMTSSDIHDAFTRFIEDEKYSKYFTKNVAKWSV